MFLYSLCILELQKMVSLCVCWELSPDPLQEQPLFSAAKPFSCPITTFQNIFPNTK